MIKDCAAGEEITENYKHIKNWELSHPYLKA